MNTIIRLFKPNEFGVAEIHEGVIVPVPHAGDTVYINRDPYRVKDVIYDWIGGNCVVDVKTVDFDEPVTATECANDNNNEGAGV